MTRKEDKPELNDPDWILAAHDVIYIGNGVTPFATEEPDQDDPAGIGARIPDPRKEEMARLEEERREALLAISPKCARGVIVEGKMRKCGDELAFHDPCSKCPCDAFLAEDGADAGAAGRRVSEELRARGLFAAVGDAPLCPPPPNPKAPRRTQR